VGFAQAVLGRPRRLQAAALCYRREAAGLEVLVITSRGSGRWIIPKGWLMRGMNAGEAAAVEAWEEAGVRPGPGPARPLGSYVYDKIEGTGLPVGVETLVFAIEVNGLEDSFPEASQRQRRWVTPAEAAEMVAEPGLKRILTAFGAQTPA
jgi:8-oxo-dGTP pyrophosphatase MutT (NUDIX family)